MPVTAQFFPGSEWTDCDYSPADDGFVFARLERPGTIWLDFATGDGRREARSGCALGRWALYLRCAADGQGNVCCVLQDGRDPPVFPAIVVLFPRDGQPREIPCPAGPAFGQNAVNVERIDDSEAGWLVYVVTSPTSYWVGELRRSTWEDSERYEWAATSQGFADGNIPLDLVRFSVPGMVCPSTVDGLSIGQNTDGPDRIRGLYQGSYFTVLPGTAFEPHLASDGRGRWLAAARTPQGAALVSLAPPFEAETGIVGPPDPPSPPDTENPPPTGDTSPMQLPDAVYDTIAACYEKLGLPEGEEAQRAVQEKVCQTVRARHGASWGWKRASGPPSADAVAFNHGDGTISVWDCVRDAGGPGRQFSLGRGSEGERVRQTFIAVEPKDWLATGTGEPPPPDPGDPGDPEPPTGTDLSAVHAKLDLILAELKRPIAILRQ